MNEPDRALIAEATRAIRIRDVILSTCHFTRPSVPPPTSEAVNVRHLTKRGVAFAVGEAKLSSEAQALLLQVTVSLGVRIADSEGEVDSAPVYFEIEADFLAEYEMTTMVSEAAIRAFAEFNSVHNVWPFWRQHVFDTVSRGRLPHLEVPLFSGP